MKPTENRVPLVLLAAFAVLLAAAFFRYEASPLVVLVPVPLLALLSGAPRWGWSRRRVAVGIFLAGLIGMLAVKYWMIANDPGEWALVGGLAALFSQLLIWIAVALAAASGYALFGWLAARFAYGPDLLRVRSVAVVPAAWIVGEYARAWAVSLAVGGPGSSLGPAGNFGNLGFALAGTPAAEPLSVIGLYGGAGAVVLSGLTLYAVCRRNLPVGSAGFAVLAVCFIAGSIPWTKPERPIQAGVVQAATGTSADANVGVPAAWQPADLLVFSEFAAVSPRTDPNGRRIAEAAARTDGVVISTESRGPAGARVGTIWFETPQGGEIARQEKTLLVPGEYLPSIGGALLGVAGGSVREDFERTRGRKPGAVRERPVVHGGVAYGALSCSGVIAPEWFRGLADQGATVLVSSSSLAVLRDRATFAAQIQQMIRFQAVANGKPMVVASRGSKSYIVAADGAFRYEAPNKDSQLGEATVEPTSGRTPYTVLGEWLVWVSLVILGVVGWSTRTHRAKRAGE